MFGHVHLQILRLPLLRSWLIDHDHRIHNDWVIYALEGLL